MRPRRRLPEQRLERQLDELAEGGRIDPQCRCRPLEGRPVVLQRGQREAGDVKPRPRELRGRVMRGRADERGLGEVARDASQLVRDLAVVEGEAAGREQRLAGGDRPFGLGGREREVDVRCGAGQELGEALIVEGRDRAEARVSASELSPACAGLF